MTGKKDGQLREGGSCMTLTVINTTTDQPSEGEHRVEHGIRRARKGDILRSSGSQVRDGGVHARRAEAEEGVPPCAVHRQIGGLVSLLTTGQPSLRWQPSQHPSSPIRRRHVSGQQPRRQGQAPVNTICNLAPVLFRKPTRSPRIIS